jgi:hypothetical protein
MTLEEEMREADARQLKAAHQTWARYVQLGLRAVACPAWRWMPGMKTTAGVRVLRVDRDGYAIGARQPGPMSPLHPGPGLSEPWPELVEVPLDAVPSLSDRATQGCLLQLLLSAYETSQVWCAPAAHHRWLCYYRLRDGVQRSTEGATIHEAMVLALEARGELEDQVDDGEEEALVEAVVEGRERQPDARGGP